jgi:hypothetical protein
MQRIVGILVAVLFVLTLGGRAHGDDTPSPQSIKVGAELLTLHVQDEAGHPKTIQKLRVTLINIGNQPVTVVTDHLDQQSETKDDGSTKLTIGMNGKVTKDGHLVVPSLTRLAPVTLQPGEAAMLEEDPLGNMHDYKGGRLTVEYSVSDFWGKRLSIWSGSASADAVEKHY